ncbi:MAG: DUF1822 family protein [Cyanobacteriota bacterium]|nr:DUF1822 family protein [Cyanobacteriota bacterium]
MNPTPNILNEFATTESLWLEFSPQEIQHAWPDRGIYSNRAACWNAFINQLCLDGFIPWLEAFLPEADRFISIWPDRSTRSSWWELLNGVAIGFGETRFILIPTETVEPDRFVVPREWVDLPSFAGDYYLSVQVEIDEERDAGWMRLLGYTTHEKLKRENRYDPVLATYSIERSEAIDDFATLWLAQKLRPLRQVELETLPVLSGDRAELLLSQLAQTAGYSPRLRQDLDIAFEEWGALLENSQWRQRLYQLRLEAARSRVQLDTTPLDTTQPETTTDRSDATHPGAINLARWLRNMGQNMGREVEDRVDSGWQTLEEVVATLGDRQPNFAYTYRSSAIWEDDASTPTISYITQLLKSHRDRQTQLSAMDLLGRIGYGNAEAIAALMEIRQNTPNADLRRQAAVSLGRIDPTNPQAGVRRAKKLNLGLRLDGLELLLVATIMPEPNSKTTVHLRVYPVGQEALPSGVQLMVLDRTDRQLLKPAIATDANNIIQLKFRCDRGDEFRVKVTFDEMIFVDDFWIE